MAMLNNQMVIVIIIQSLGRRDLTTQSMSRSLGHNKITLKPREMLRPEVELRTNERSPAT